MRELAFFIAGFATFDLIFSQLVAILGIGPDETRELRSMSLALSSAAMYLFAIFLILI
jgi:hypothetical protein